MNFQKAPLCPKEEQMSKSIVKAKWVNNYIFVPEGQIVNGAFYLEMLIMVKRRL